MDCLQRIPKYTEHITWNCVHPLNRGNGVSITKMHNLKRQDNIAIICIHNIFSSTLECGPLYPMQDLPKWRGIVFLLCLVIA